jgi:hypothetical protein
MSQKVATLKFISLFVLVFIHFSIFKKPRRVRWAGHVARMGEKRNVYRLLIRTPEGKRPLERPRRSWMDNITMELLKIGLSIVDWIGLAQDRYRWRALVNAVTNLRVS